MTQNTSLSLVDDTKEVRWNAHEVEQVRLRKAERMRAAMIPRRFAGASLDNFEVKNAGQRGALEAARGYARNFEEHYAAGRCLVLSGRVGTGKTHLACAILRDIIARPLAAENYDYYANEAWHPVRYVTATDIIRTIRETWNNPEVREADAIRKFTRPHLLVIDEVGRSFGSDSEKTQIEELLDLRYQAMKPTLVCTNCDKAQIAQFLGERGFDRLRENGGISMVFEWASHRGRG
jgi:DNA replication protein DnaC